MNIANLLKLLRLKKIYFKEVLSIIDAEYDYIPSIFRNGNKINNASENPGSAKVLYFGKINNISKDDTLFLFAEHYESVLEDPDGNSHQNIREFLQYGWEHVYFESPVLFKKKEGLPK